MAPNDEIIRFSCRFCKKVTDQHERIVTHRLPEYVKVLECHGCGKLSVCQLDMVTSYADIDGCD
jgi:hypothetical protein